MTMPDRIYERTEAGLKALDDSSSALRAETRWVLALVKTGTHADLVRSGMRHYPEQRVADMLAELESLGFIKSVPATSDHNLDFTGNFSLAELAAAAKKSRQ
jgi:hypothetical protein